MPGNRLQYTSTPPYRVGGILSQNSRDNIAHGSEIIALDSSLKSVSERKVKCLRMASGSIYPIHNLDVKSKLSSKASQQIKLKTQSRALEVDESKYSPTENTGAEACT